MMALYWITASISENRQGLYILYTPLMLKKLSFDRQLVIKETKARIDRFKRIFRPNIFHNRGISHFQHGFFKRQLSLELVHQRRPIDEFVIIISYRAAMV